MERLETKVIIKNVRLSYAHVYEPRAMQGSDEKKYSLVALLDKGDTKTVEAIKVAVANAIHNAGLTKLTVAKAMDNLLHDGDERDSEAYKGKYYINMKTDKKPNLCKKVGDKLIDLTYDTNEEIYSGCYAMVSANLHAYARNGNMGVGAYIRAVCKTDEGERLSGGVSNAADDFGIPFEQKSDFNDLF